MLVHSGHAVARRFFNPATAPSYDTIVNITTFGQDARWKREILELVGTANAVLDLACGTGILTSLLQRSVSPPRFVAGLDLIKEYMLQARQKADLPLAQGTAEVLPYRSEVFDAVVSSYLAKYVDMDLVAEECWRVLKPGGIVVFHDFTRPSRQAIISLWGCYFSILRFFGTFFRSWQAVFNELDSVISQSQWVAKTQQALRRSGFKDIVTTHHTLGTAAIVAGRKP